jgi:hypothetical protein
MAAQHERQVMKIDRKDPNIVAIDKRARGTLEKVFSSGASRLLISQAPFKIKDHLNEMKVTTNKGTTPITKRRQFSDYEELWDDPYGLPYTFVISSSPNDIMAQMVALRFMLRAQDRAKEGGHGRPVWHPVKGGIAPDKLRDNSRDRSIGMLILSNVPVTSTPYKFEKLRDIMTTYSDIPKVVVTTDVDPVAFMQDCLKMPANFVMYLGAKKETRV